MNGGELTGEGAKVFPHLAEKSANDFSDAVDSIVLGAHLEADSEERLRDAAETVKIYMLNPTDAGKQEGAAEILAAPEFVAIRAAFYEALSENVSKVMPAALPGFE